MSQQLPDTDLLIKMGCLYLFLRLWLLPLPLTKLSQLLPFFSRFLCLMQKHLREVTPVSDRKGLWGRRVSGLFFLQTDGEKEGEAVFLPWWQEKPAILLPSPTKVGLSLSFLLTNLDHIMNHRSYPSSTCLCGYTRHTLFHSVFLTCHINAWMGPTLLHSWSASNSAPTPLTHRNPLYCLTPSFSVFILNL